jgi:hypothetical protein
VTQEEAVKIVRELKKVRGKIENNKAIYIILDASSQIPTNNSQCVYFFFIPY